MNIKKRNYALTYIQSATYNILALIAGGSIFQTFLLESGLNETQVSVYVSVLQAVQTFTMLLLSRALDQVRKILTWVAVCLATYFLQFGAMLVLCLHQNMPVDGKYLLLFALGVVFNIFQGIYLVICYKQPHLLIDMKDYGRLTGQSGALAGLVGIGASALLTFLLGRFAYFNVMTAVVLGGMFFTLITAGSNLLFVPIGNGLTEKKPKKINLFRYKPFYQLLFPNFARGVSQGIFTLIAVIGYHRGVLDSSAAALLVTVSQIATLLGCQSFAYLSAKQKNALLCLLSGVVMVVLMPLMTVGGQTLFVALYFLLYLFNIYISHAVPVIVAKRIDYDCLGQYTAWRMLIFNLGSSLGSALVPILLESTGAFGTLLVCGLSMLPCGIGYYLFERRYERQEAADLSAKETT